MMSHSVPCAVVGLLHLVLGASGQGTSGTGTATLDDISTMASSAHTKLSSMMDSASEMNDKLHAHVENAKSFADKAQDTICKFPGFSSFDSCKGSAPNANSTGCVGAGCCPASSCLTNSLPGVKCDGSRGTTTCVGASMFSLTEGQCQCKVGVCRASGQCGDAPIGGSTAPATSPTAAWAASTAAAPYSGQQQPAGAIQRLDAEGGVVQVVPRENVWPAATGYLTSVALLVVGAFLVKRVAPSRWSTVAASEQEQGPLLQAEA